MVYAYIVASRVFGVSFVGTELIMYRLKISFYIPIQIYWQIKTQQCEIMVTWNDQQMYRW